MKRERVRMRRVIAGATAEAHRSSPATTQGPAIGRAVVSQMMLAVLKMQPYYKPSASSPADHRWAIAFLAV